MLKFDDVVLLSSSVEPVFTVLFVLVVINDKAPLIWSTGLVDVEPWALA